MPQILPTMHRRGVGPTIFVAYDGMQLVDFCGPFDILGAANQLLASKGRPALYRLEAASLEGKAVRTSVGLGIAVDRSLASIRGPIDTLLVPGRLDARAFSPTLVQAVARLAQKAKRVVSVCSGTFVLAAAGLLDGKRVTTHWAGCARLAADYPRIKVEPDRIWVRDGKIWSSAGVTAGMDLALALVEEDLDRQSALELARWFVMYLRRPGGQSQFSGHLATQIADHDLIREIVQWINDQPRADLSVEALALKANMSPRNFARVFRQQLRTTPARYVAKARLEIARRRLEESKAPLKVIAKDCGLGSVESLRRAFQASLKITPGEYRARF
jgi:transcriptional regulator GlxA family with amidase domain